jgi:hypothetical protein
MWLFFRSALLPHEPASLAIPAGELPTSRSTFGWLETAAPQIISDRFDNGGLTIGTAPRLGVHGTSAADTTFRIDGLNASSVLRPGMPMVLPDVVGAASIGVTRLPSDPSINAPGPVIDWQPLAGGKRTVVAETFFMPKAWTIASNPTGVTPIQQLTTLADGSLLMSGELVPGKSNGAISAHWTRSGRLERANPTAINAAQLSLVGHLTLTPTTSDTVDALTIVERASPSTIEGATARIDSYGTAQLSLRHAAKGRASYRVAGGYQWTDTTAPPAALSSIDTAFDGAAFPAIFRPAGKESALRLATDLSLTPRVALGMTHRLQTWGSFDRSSMTPSLASTLVMAEKVNGVAARVWRIDVPATAPSWTSSTAALAVNDRIGAENAWFELGVRVETLHASNGGSSSITWTGIYPHAAFDLFSAKTGLGIFGTYTRSAASLPPMALAFGDVNAPAARVYRWIDTNTNGVVDGTEASGTPALIARVGPGAAGGLTALDAAIERPSIDLFMGGVRIDTSRFALSATAISRIETNFIRAIADGGAVYSLVTQPDPNADFTSPTDDQMLAAYNRTPGSFGLDHYTLTNPAAVGEGSSFTLDILAQYRGPKLRLAFSAAAIRAMGSAANRGFRSDENDAGLIGEVPSNPNAASFAAGGRTFFDRGYVGKILGVFTLPGHASLGIVARYQDGQPFSRLAIFDNLNQGPEAVVAYGNGRPTRFKFISTTDVRLQKAFAVGSGEVTVIIDAFNAFNIGREVEEYVLTNAAFRTVTAIEPPRTLRLGLRFKF